VAGAGGADTAGGGIVTVLLEEGGRSDVASEEAGAFEVSATMLQVKK
jgi:hypothetical protein